MVRASGLSEIVGVSIAVSTLLVALTGPVHAVANNAVFVSQTAPPPLMEVGEPATVSVTMRNTGTATWTQSGAYILVPVNPVNSAFWGPTYLQLGPADSVPPEEEHTFSFAIQAPRKPGTYVFRWQMHQYAFGTYFGERTPEIVVQVTAPGCNVSRFAVGAVTDEETFQKQGGSWPPTGATTQQNDNGFNLQQRSAGTGSATMAVTAARWLTGNTIPADAVINGASLGVWTGALRSDDNLNFAAMWMSTDTAPSVDDYLQELAPNPWDTRRAFGRIACDAVTAQSPASGAAANTYFQLAYPQIDRAANGWTKLIFGIVPASWSAAPTGLNYHAGRSAEVPDMNNEGALTLDVYWCPGTGTTPTWTAIQTPTPTSTPPSTLTPTRTATAEPNCQYTTFRVASADDGYMSKIDPSGAWPPAGGSGLVDLSGAVTVVAEGASNVNGFYVQFLGAVPWPAGLYIAAGNPSLEVWNLGVNNQTSVDMTAIDEISLPWVETANHSYCSNASDQGIAGASCSMNCQCPQPHACNSGGGGDGLQSDLVALDPNVVILTPESNDALWPWLYQDQIDVTPQDIVDRLDFQCGLVTAHNPAAVCIVPTMHKPPYVAQNAATNAFIDNLNTILRSTFDDTHVVDFDTDSSNQLDYPVDTGHIGRRLHDKRASRVLSTLTQTTFTTTAPILETEIRKWNGTSGRSIAFVRFPTAALPDTADIRRANLEVFSTYSGAPGAIFGIRNVAIQWANAAAADGWSIADWPTTVTADAFDDDYPAATALTISEWKSRSFRFTFGLDNPSTVSRTGYTGFYIFLDPDTGAHRDNAYFTSDLVSYDAPTGPQATGDQAARLTVYWCGS